MRQSWTLWALCVLLAATGCNSSKTSDQGSDIDPKMLGGDDVTPVIAKVGDWEITQGYFDARYERLTPSERSRFSGENWKSRFLDYLVEETLLYREAKATNWDRLADVAREIDYQTRSVLVTYYHDTKFKVEIEPPMEAIEEYYEENQEIFKSEARLLCRHIQCDSADRINEAWAAHQNGEPWGRVVAQFSEDENTRDNGGLLGWFNPGGYVPGLGFDEEYTAAAFALPVGPANPPMKINDKWYILRIDAKTEETINPLAEVHDRIVATLRPIYGKEAYESHLAELRAKHPVQRLGEYQQRDVRTADQLFALANESQNAHAKIDYFQALVSQYPNDERAASSLFMVGFLYSEQFGDVAGAVTTFRRLIREFPDSEYVDEAHWMIANAGRQEPRLMTGGTPRDSEEVLDRIDDVQN